jgi:hypothetical protein
MNYYGIYGCGFLLLLCVAILWASENEDRVKLLVHDVMTCLRCINNGEDL